MNQDVYKEGRRHGDATFPIGVYQVNESGGHTLFDLHWHEEIEFIYVVEGTALFQIGTTHLEVQAGEALFIQSEELHAALVAPEAILCHLFAVVFDLKLLSGSNYDVVQSKYLDPLFEHKLFLPTLLKASTSWEQRIIAELREIIALYGNKPLAFEILIKAKLYAIFAEFFANLQSTLEIPPITADLQKIERLKKVLQFMDDNLHTRIQIKDAAAILQMSEGHFCRFFKSLVHKTPMDYINMLRINQAAKLLSESNTKIIDIALEVGFENPSYFIKLFKRHKKCTPSEFRKLQKK
jgi:AraC-like DNA-binding protein